MLRMRRSQRSIWLDRAPVLMLSKRWKPSLTWHWRLVSGVSCCRAQKGSKPEERVLVSRKWSIQRCSFWFRVTRASGAQSMARLGQPSVPKLTVLFGISRDIKKRIYCRYWLTVHVFACSSCKWSLKFAHTLVLCFTVLAGAVHKYLEDHAPEYVVLRPNWFFQNFEDKVSHLGTIRQKQAIYSASEDGKVSFIDAEARCHWKRVFVLGIRAHNMRITASHFSAWKPTHCRSRIYCTFAGVLKVYGRKLDFRHRVIMVHSLIWHLFWFQ